MSRSHAITRGGRGIGSAIAERLLADGGIVVAVDRDDTTLGWTTGRRIIALAGGASDEAATGQAVGLAQDAGTLAGWVNKAACLLMPGWTPCPRTRADLIMANVSTGSPGGMLPPAQNSLFRRDSNGHVDNQLADHIGGSARVLPDPLRDSA